MRFLPVPGGIEDGCAGKAQLTVAREGMRFVSGYAFNRSRL